MGDYVPPSQLLIQHLTQRLTKTEHSQGTYRFPVWFVPPATGTDILLRDVVSGVRCPWFRSPNGTHLNSVKLTGLGKNPETHSRR